jgi:rhodanese-related sulfurtransferase
VVVVPTKNPQEPFSRVTVDEAKLMLKNSTRVIDVRETGEYVAGHLPGAAHIPVASVFDRREELPKDGKLLFVCAVGQRSALACEMAAAAGIPPKSLYNLEGGTQAWIKAGEPVEQ